MGAERDFAELIDRVHGREIQQNERASSVLVATKNSAADNAGGNITGRQKLEINGGRPDFDIALRRDDSRVTGIRQDTPG
jgi:hypothetical protein